MSPQTRVARGLAPVSRRRTPTVSVADTGADTLAALTVTLRVQRRLAMRTMALLITGLLAGPVVLGAPWLRRARVLDVPVLWLVLGLAAYPLLLLLAHRHRRGVDRLEAALARRDAR